jgi:hypothetical protein
MKRRGPEWRKTRSDHLRVYPECRICDVDVDVVVHHLRYRGRAGVSERPGDLVTLCSAHHEELHRTLGRTPALDAQLAFINDRATGYFFWVHT